MAQKKNKSRTKKDRTLEYLEKIIDIIPAPLYWEDVNSVIRGINQQCLKGVGADKSLIGNSPYDHYSYDVAKHIVAHNEEVMRTGKILAQEEPIEDLTTGEIKYFTAVKGPLRNEKGKIIGIIGTSIDISDRKKAEEQLKIEKEKAEAASRAKSEFITNMSHDIRTPLAGIVSIAGRLSEKARSPEEKEQLELMEDGATQLLSLLNNVLDIASAERSHEEILKDEIFNLQDSIKNISTLVLPNIKAKNLQLIMKVDSHIPRYVIGDQVKFERILLNLLGNAIKFTEKGEITFQAKVIKQEGGMCEIEWSIIDTGIGIPENEKSKIFDRFFRASPSYKGLYKGNGVGLYIAQKFVEQLGGEKIHVESEEGEGTRFYFILPMEMGRPPEINQEMDVSIAWTPRQEPYKILLVEDTKIARIAAKFLLEELNCTLRYAADGETALREAIENKYELIFMDVGLPDISGTEVTQMIRRREMSTHQHVPIIGLSAHIDKTIRQEAYQAGMDEVLIKPLLKNQAKAALARFCGDNSRSGVKSIESITAPMRAEEIFNVEALQSKFGKKAALQELLESFIEETLSTETLPLANAYAKSDWETLEKIAHSIKGAALSVDALKLAAASEKLVACCRSESQENVNDRYYDLLQVMEATKLAVKAFLAGKS